MSATTGVARYMAKKDMSDSRVTGTTGVERYLAKQAGLAKDTSKALTGVDKYLRNLG